MWKKIKTIYANYDSYNLLIERFLIKVTFLVHFENFVDKQLRLFVVFVIRF